MIEVRIHGRGGQGGVLASMVMAHAVQRHGYHVQVFPQFGVERRNVPVTAFARFDRKPIRLRTQVTQPDCLLVLDPSLPRYMPVTQGLKPGGCIVLNAEDPSRLAVESNGWRVVWVDATAIAARHGIGTTTAPIVNTTMIGAFAAATGLFGEDDLLPAMSAVVPHPERNAEAAREAYRSVKSAPSETSVALQRLYEGSR